MKHPTKPKNDPIADCRKKRDVKRCEDCCRYEECFKGKEVDWHFENCLLLGNAIVEDIGRDYCEAWKNGGGRQKRYLENLLRSRFIEIITANETNGYALQESLAKHCQAKYGDFETIRERKRNNLLAKINELKISLAHTRIKENKRALSSKIARLRGDINEI